jgi:hypothetical protein
MRLIVLNPETKLPEPSPECLLIPEFREIWKRVNKIDGDRLGVGKVRNLQEIGYIYYNGVYDSRFKLVQDEKEKREKIKGILKLPVEWIPDATVLAAAKIFIDTQVTSSSELVESVDNTNMDVAAWIRVKRAAIRAGSASPKDVSEILDIIDRMPSVIESTKRAKATLQMEQENRVSGRNGRTPNKFELPKVKVPG